MNVIKAFELAKEKQITTIAFVGESGGKMAQIADISLRFPANTSHHIQNMHLAFGHILCELIEKSLYHE